VTYSIVAWDSDTSATGVAVQSHWFSVGSLVAWAEAGIGAVATQANIEISYGTGGLARLREGESPTAALAALIAADPQASFRQVAIADAAGRVAAHTGADCMEFAGDAQGEHHSCQANLMTAPGVPEAMSRPLRRPPATSLRACSPLSSPPRRPAATSAAASRRR
jgi:uncharacterized Ntn-hydrolase superfamily protein